MNSSKFISVAMLIAAAGVGMVSCSEKDDDGAASKGREISFNVTVPRSSAKAPVTSSTIDEFQLWSFVEGKVYMPDVTVSKAGNSWDTSPVMYWPADGSEVNFYCISPRQGNSANIHTDAPNIENYVIGDGKTDLIYAVTKNQTEANNPVKINFRHALSKLDFKLRASSSSAHAPLKVVVSGVELTDVCGTGSFTYPDATTAENTDVSGKWSEIGGKNNVVIYSGDQTVLTEEYASISKAGAGYSGYEFALPQSLSQSEADLSGAYVKVNCAIYDKGSDVRIWPKGSETSGYLYFPLNSAGDAVWNAGKAYSYNITIGIPEGSSKIEFDVTVDDYPSFEDMSVE